MHTLTLPQPLQPSQRSVERQVHAAAAADWLQAAVGSLQGVEAAARLAALLRG